MFQMTREHFIKMPLRRSLQCQSAANNLANSMLMCVHYTHVGGVVSGLSASNTLMTGFEFTGCFHLVLNTQSSIDQ